MSPWYYVRRSGPCRGQRRELGGKQQRRWQCYHPPPWGCSPPDVNIAPIGTCYGPPSCALHCKTKLSDTLSISLSSLMAEIRSIILTRSMASALGLEQRKKHTERWSAVHLRLLCCWTSTKKKHMGRRRTKAATFHGCRGGCGGGSGAVAAGWEQLEHGRRPPAPIPTLSASAAQLDDDGSTALAGLGAPLSPHVLLACGRSPSLFSCLVMRGG